MIHLAKLITPWWKPLAGAVAAAFAYLFPDQTTADAVIGAGLLVGLDLITGTAAALSLTTWDGSCGLRRTVNKVLSYLAVIAVCAVVTRNVSGMAQYHAVSVTGVLTLIILTESVSILENVQKLGVTLPFGLGEVLTRRLADEDRDKENHP